MRGSMFATLCGALLIIAAGSLPASAQRPAAWDTRVKTTGVPPSPASEKPAMPREPQPKTKHESGPTGGQKKQTGSDRP